MAEALTGKPPKFGGSTGGLLTKALVEEKYAITWTSSKEQVFEMPTGGAAIMNEGDNLMYLALKEQCSALGLNCGRNSNPKSTTIKSIGFSLTAKLNTCILKMAFSLKKSTKDANL